MLRRDYNNFVRSATTEVTVTNKLSGEEAQKLYLEELQQKEDTESENLRAKVHVNTQSVPHTGLKRNPDNLEISNLQLFTIVQDNDVHTLQQILDDCPDKINTVDDYGWSLLMIACQAKSYEAVRELLNRRIDTMVRDKAGNSTQSLIVRNKDSYLADIFLSHVSNRDQPKKDKFISKIKHKKRCKEKYVCESCDGKAFDSKNEHLSSTVHNINASKGKKIPSSYVIPQSNKGYQIMLKTGWDRETGLGPDGCGKMYPIKAVQKYDKKGLGHQQKQISSTEESTKNQVNKYSENAYERNRRIEINFRRQFY